MPCQRSNGTSVPVKKSVPDGCFVVDLDGHQHGEGCGHQLVQHGDHWDYLVDGRLHHVISEDHSTTCQDDTCSGHLKASAVCCLQHHLCGLLAGQVVDHGLLELFAPVDLNTKESLLDKPMSPKQFLAKAFSFKAFSFKDGMLSRRFSARSFADHGQSTDPPITTRIHAAGICCPAEVPLITSILQPLPGVVSVEVQVLTKVVTVEHRADLCSPATLLAALNSAHLDAILHTQTQGARAKSNKWPPWTVLLSGLLLAVALVSYGEAYEPALEHFKWVALGAVVVGIPPILLKAWVAVRHWQLDINFLMTVAVAGAIGLGEYVEAAAIVFLFSLAEWLEDRCLDRARSSLTAVLQLQPDTALLKVTPLDVSVPTAGAGKLVDAVLQEVPIEQVPVGGVVVVRPGDRVPVDGTVIRGDSAVDESMLTGETRAVPKSPGSQVCSGTVNVGRATLEVEATAVSGDSTVSRLARLMESAAAQKSRRERVVEVFARWYTPLVVLGAALVALVPSLVHRDDWQHWVYIALVVLVTACPCALVISTPVSAVCGLSRAARQGVVVKGSVHLETLGRLTCVTFDKSGTLTQGRFNVVHAETPPGDPATALSATTPTLNQVLSLAAAIETHSSHPLAPAIIGYAAAKPGFVSYVAADTAIVPGEGVTGRVNGHSVAVGSARLALQTLDRTASGDTGALVPSAKASEEFIQAVAAEWGGKGATTCFVVVDGSLAAVLAAKDEPRPTAAKAVAMLAKRHVQCAMLTGDNRGTAAAIAQQLHLDPTHVHAELLPADKLDLVKAYTQGTPPTPRAQLANTCGRSGSARISGDHVTLLVDGPGSGHSGFETTTKKTSQVVAHVGDGINDAPALAVADVGIAIGVGGSALAMEAADVALFGTDLRTLPFAMDLGRHVTRVISINIIISMAVKVAVLVLAFFGYISLWMSVLADVGSALVVIGHGLSVLVYQNDKKPSKTAPVCVAVAHAAKAKAGEVTSAGNSACCASKACGGHSHAAPAVALVTKSAGSCCASKACCGHSHAAPAATPVNCCASKACGGHSHAAPAAAPVTKPADSCCASKACCSHSHAAPAAALVTKPADSCCGSKACCGHSHAAPAAAPATKPADSCCASKDCCGH